LLLLVERCRVYELLKQSIVYVVKSSCCSLAVSVVIYWHYCICFLLMFYLFIFFEELYLFNFANILDSSLSVRIEWISCFPVVDAVVIIFDMWSSFWQSSERYKTDLTTCQRWRHENQGQIKEGN